MKYINGLDTDKPEETCPKDERVAWDVKPGFEKVRLVTVRRYGGVRIYGEEGGIMDMPIPHFHDKEDSPSDKERVYGKYRIIDAKTGEEKDGLYFVLKVDAKDADERRAVFEALFEYAREQARSGRATYAKEVINYATGGVAVRRD